MFRISGFKFYDGCFGVRGSGFVIGVSCLVLSRLVISVSGFGFRVSSFVFRVTFLVVSVSGFGVRDSGNSRPPSEYSRSC